MKTSITHVLLFFNQRRTQRDIRSLVKFVGVLALLIVLYSVVFHYIMEYEHRLYPGKVDDHSWITGFYWTLTVMSTLGFGDITFQSDLGKVFSMVVLATGIIFLLILLPFTIIQFFYAPWVEAQANARTPRQLPAETRGHVILTHHNAVTEALIRKLDRSESPYVLLVPDFEDASRLHDMGLNVMFGALDDPETYRLARTQAAALVATTYDDVVNTNVAFMVRQVSPEVPIAATATGPVAASILRLAGATRVLQLGTMLGRALARCMVGGDAITHVVGQLDELRFAEANAARTPITGKTLREARLSDLGVSVIGIWERGVFHHATPETVIGEHSVLMLAGSAEQLLNYDEDFAIYNVSIKPVLILGGGRVGSAAAEALTLRAVNWRLVDLNPQHASDSERDVVGDARDPDVLKRAGLFDAPAIIITTHDDALNIYLTIYCRSVRPDIQIITRATHERNIDTLHRAGADFVHSYASMGSVGIHDMIRRDRVATLTEGLDVFRTPVPGALDAKTLIESGVRERTGCTIVALRDADGTLVTNPPADTVLREGQEMVLAGSAESEASFRERYAD
ncbi:MAG: potassium transporter [Phycisphaeraceae bacterium]|nr:MAG: potassium transporter [Phycisphaeraceae bacterium]